MSILRGFIHRPQRVWLRRVNFQIHLWAGLILTLYLIVIGITGAILVFREEIENPWHNLQATAPPADPVTVITSVRAAFPQSRLLTLTAPTKSNPVYTAILQGRGRRLGESRIALNPMTGQILGPVPRRSTWLNTIRNLHETLLIGVTGRQINAILAGILLLINLTGVVVWWPGIKTWTRALTVDFARGWRRINFDLHRAAGFWTLAIVTMWAISGVYFGYSGEARTYINRISPLVSAEPPRVRVEPQRGTADLRTILTQAASLDPGTTLRSIAFPSGRRAPLEIAMQRPDTTGAEFADTLYFDPYDGTCLAIWKYGINQSLGDWFIWLQIPLHFGTYWGLTVKIIWATSSLILVLLCVTGALMYWNRYLRRHLPFAGPGTRIDRRVVV